MKERSEVLPLGLLKKPTRYLFFTGKGGVGKTSLACAVALALTGARRAVLLVSTDPASNLDEMLGEQLTDTPGPVHDSPGLFAMNIDPEAAAETYRQRVLQQMGAEATEEERAAVREQLSGACTTEIAAFDAFVELLGKDAAGFDHIVFDTAPTGHTLRLLSLPKAWTGFLEGNDRGASCLGPHSGLKMREGRFRDALNALCDPSQTTIVLITRPDAGAVTEAARMSNELRALDLTNQRLVVNGVFTAIDSSDPVARSLQDLGEWTLSRLPPALKDLPQDRVPLRAFDMVGLPALRAVLGLSPAPTVPKDQLDLAQLPRLPDLHQLIEELASSDRGLIMVMGKGGVGKTTIAVAVAIGLVHAGKTVHLSTTDPAAHLAVTLAGGLPGLEVDRIDPKTETERYVDKIMSTKGHDLDDAGKALLREDLRSPCTEEVAVFHAFAQIVGKARSAFVVLDTAPTGHTLLLLDATGAYHRQMVRDLEPLRHGRIVTPLMRLQDPAFTRILLVTLPEITPVSEAATLQEDLRRAAIQPFAWVINRSLLAAGTRDPVLAARLTGERLQIRRVRDGLAERVFVVPWQTIPPVGIAALSKLGGY
jgi:arsenite/tail-anchored protein-transporting ATPase